jgi:hypothetical protein
MILLSLRKETRRHRVEQSVDYVSEKVQMVVSDVDSLVEIKTSSRRQRRAMGSSCVSCTGEVDLNAVTGMAATVDIA